MGLNDYIQYAINSILPEKVPYKEPGIANGGSSLTGPAQAIGPMEGDRGENARIGTLVEGPYAGPYAPPTVPPGSTIGVPMKNPATFMPRERRKKPLRM